VYAILPWLWQPKALQLQLQTGEYGPENQDSVKALQAEWFPPLSVELGTGHIQEIETNKTATQTYARKVDTLLDQLNFAIGSKNEDFFRQDDF
jgi:muramidase (phage lysozyme)